jgi:hypothetical protein
VAIVVTDIAAEAAKASTYISTSQNFVELEAGGSPATIAVHISNAGRGEEANLSWSIASYPDDASDKKVVKFTGGTGRPAYQNSAQARSAEGSIARDIAQGFAVFEGLNPGRAEVIISHPLALYPTKILIHVYPAQAAALPALRRFRAAGAPRPYLSTRQNVVILTPGSPGREGKVENISIQAVNINPSSYKDISWSCSNPQVVSLKANGSSAGVLALAEEGEALITVTHPLAANSLEIYVSIGERYVYKNSPVAYITTDSDVINLYAGEAEAGFQSILVWSGSGRQVKEGFSYRISDSALAEVAGSPFGASYYVKPLKPGKAVITISHQDAAFDKQVLLIIHARSLDEAVLPYLKTEYPFVSLKEGENAVLTCGIVSDSAAESVQNSIAVLASDASAWSWVSDSPSSVAVITTSGGTAMIRAHAKGLAALTVRHTGASTALRIIVKVLDKEPGLGQEYIKLSTRSANFAVGDSYEITAAFAGDNAKAAASGGFSWSLSDSSIALVDYTENAAVLRGLKAGTTYLHVNHPASPQGYGQSVIVNVRERGEEDCYINLDQKIIKMKGTPGENSTIKANLVGGELLDARDFVWWVDDPGLIHLTPLAGQANILPLGGEGVTTVHVSHRKAASPADALIIVSRVQDFGFSVQTKTLTQGSFCFILVNTPPIDGAHRVEYSSSAGAVCSVAGSKKVALLSGIKAGHAEISARMLGDQGKLIAESNLAVIVEPAPLEPVTLSSSQTVLSLEKGKSMVIPVSISGSRVRNEDRLGIVWNTSDAGVVSISGSGSGDSAYISAIASGEAVLSLSHPRFPEASLSIWLIVPDDSKKSIVLDSALLSLAKDDGAATLTATILNGRDEDYKNLSWSAAKSEGRNIVSLGRDKGKQCSVIPRAVGSTTVIVRLPSGQDARCLVTITESAEIYFETKTVSLNPGYTEKVKYRTIPPSAPVTWFAQFPGMGQSGVKDPFSYTVDEVEQTLSITGLEPGKGSVSALFAGGGGSAAASLNVIIEWSSSFELDKAAPITREPIKGSVIDVGFTVFPHDLEVYLDEESPGWDGSRLRLHSITVDENTGIGKASFEPLWEAEKVTATFKTKQKEGIAAMERKQDFILRYNKLEPKLMPAKLRTGAYSSMDASGITLGDGEAMLLYVDFGQDNIDVSAVDLKWIPTGAYSLDNTTNDKEFTNIEGYIRLTKETGNSERQYWRLEHSKDHVDEESYYYVSHDMYYNITDTEGNTRTIGTLPQQGLSAWRIEEWYPGITGDKFFVKGGDDPLPRQKLLAVSNDNSLSASLSMAELRYFIHINADLRVSMKFGELEYPHSNNSPFAVSKRLPRLSDTGAFSNALDPKDTNSWYDGADSRKIAFKLALRALSSTGEAQRTFSFRKGQEIWRLHYGMKSPDDLAYYDPSVIHYPVNPYHMDRTIKSYFVRSISPADEYCEHFISSEGTMEVSYSPRTPFLIAKNDFESNPNWYRDEKMLDSIELPAVKFHHYADIVHRQTVNDTTKRIETGSIQIIYKDAGQNAQSPGLPVTISLRDNVAYTSNKWSMKALNGVTVWEESQ